MEAKIDEWFGYWIKVNYRKMTNLHDQKLAKYGLTTSQVGVLAQLWNIDGLTQKEIQQKLQIRAASLTGIVDSLVEKGWVVRKNDMKDARVKRLYITSEGKSLEKVCLEVVAEMENTLKNGFSKEEMSLMVSWMKRIHGNLT